MTTQFRTQNGTWRVASTERFEPGARIVVYRRNGTSSEVIVGALLATDPDRELPYLYAFEDARRAAVANPEPQNTVTEIARGAELIALMQRAQRRPLAQDGTPGHIAHVRFALTNTPRGLRLEIAGPSSRYAGQLLALSQERGRAGRRQLYGRLVADAATATVYIASVGQSQIEQHIHREIVEVLRAFANDPAGYSGAHGRATGQCCYCGRGLTDPRSVTVGYGPICADYYGLPWGDAPPPPFDVTRGPASQRNRMLAEAVPQPSEGEQAAQDWATNDEDEPETDSLVTLGENMTDIVRRELTERIAVDDGVPTLEDIQNEPSAMRRMAMAAQRQSAGLPPLASRNARGELINATNASIVTQTYRRAQEASAAPMQRIPRNAATPTARERLAERRRTAAARTTAQGGAAALGDETVTTTSWRATPRPAQRLTPTLALREEDDFIWPPRI
jgi:hypothetical protein